MAHHVSSRGAGSSRMVFWILALIVIGGLGWFVWQKSKAPVAADKPAASELAAILVSDHRKVWSEEDAAFPVKKVEEIDAANRVFFGQDTPMTELNGSGLSFKGGRELTGTEKIPGPPPVPGQEMEASLGPRSAVYRLESDGTQGEAGVRCTVILQKYMLPRRDDGTDPLKVRTSYTLKADGLEGGAPPILIYRQGGIVFYMITDKPGGYDLFKKAFSIPDPEDDY